MKDIKWAVLGTGVIANEMAQALIKKGKSIYSVANRTHQKAVEFAKKYNINKVYEDRMYVCECGNRMDRDVNAAVNIREEGKRIYKECA